MALKLTPARPVTASTGRNSHTHGVAPVSISITPKPAAAAYSMRTVTTVRRAASSAPTSDPTAMVEFNQPYSPAPPSNSVPA